LNPFFINTNKHKMSSTELPADEEIETYDVLNNKKKKEMMIETYDVLADEENKEMMIETTEKTSALTLMLASSRSHQRHLTRLPREVWAMVVSDTRGEREFYEDVLYQKCASLFQDLQDLHTNPILLNTLCSEKMKITLHCQGNPKAMGTGNMPTDQEACFACLLEKHGFGFMPKNAPNPMKPSFMYKYQLRGSQQSGDFGLYAFNKGEIIKELIIDLKHTNSKTIMLNDGWFEKKTIYVITWNTGTKKFPSLKTLIGFGQDIPSKEENEHHDEQRTIRKKLNAMKKKVGSYMPYNRGADGYHCGGFTPDITSKRLESVLTAMAPRRSTPFYKTDKDVCAASHAPPHIIA